MIDCVAGGGIIALKGVGGYHLACDAGDEQVVAELRRRKGRPDKPFAVLVADLTAAEVLCQLDPAGRDVLESAWRPVVLAPARAGAALAASIAPGLVEIGVMLPSSPLHELLVTALRRPLVMTSGNRSGDPVLHRDGEAESVLGPLCEGVLGHAGPSTCAWTTPSCAAGRASPQLLRRARGWVPQPLRLPVEAAQPVLAVGAHLKSTVGADARPQRCHEPAPLRFGFLARVGCVRRGHWTPHPPQRRRACARGSRPATGLPLHRLG